MNTRRLLEWGGLAASVVLIIFGAAALYMGFDGRSTVQDSLKQEQIYFGEASDPAVAKYADQWAGQQVTTGEQARAFAKIMREHTLESSGGLTYAQMGRFQSAANPSDQKGTNDEAAAAKDPSGQPIANGARNLWVTETALTTALTTLQTESQSLSSSLATVQTRQEFTKAMIDTLQAGSASLTLADSNQEGANLLALQTRQQLSSTALSLASQADQNVLRLFQG